MTERGWERQNMLHDQYFLDGRSALTDAGRMKIQWILTEAPSQHRTIYVRCAANPPETAARIEAVRAYLAQVMPGQPQPPVLETTLTPPGWPAERVNVVSRRFIDSMPDPKMMKEGVGGGK
jgi:hypothetical protein